MRPRLVTILSILAAAAVLRAAPASAHCDTLNGPVVASARIALEKSDVTPVLKWVKPQAEAEIRAAFAQALEVRKGGTAARALADRYFFETLVRVHRAGEGAPYTGLKPADAPVEPAVREADRALEGGARIDGLVNLVTAAVSDGIRERWQRVQEARKHADDSVEAGRRYVEAYVEYVHYAEALHAAAGGHASHAEQEPGPATRQ